MYRALRSISFADIVFVQPFVVFARPDLMSLLFHQIE